MACSNKTHTVKIQGWRLLPLRNNQLLYNMHNTQFTTSALCGIFELIACNIPLHLHDQRCIDRSKLHAAIIKPKLSW